MADPPTAFLFRGIGTIGFAVFGKDINTSSIKEI
jgi:hypothetical protein